MSADLPAELDPEDLPDDPAVLKELVCELYAALVASDEFVEAAEGDLDAEAAEFGWLTQHLAAGGPAGHDPEK
jgi:hypothetical protein